MLTYLLFVSAAMCGSLLLESQAKSVGWGPIPLGELEIWGKIGWTSRKYWPLTDQDKIASRKARFLAELYRPFVKTGFLEIPPLDPYFAKHLSPLRIRDQEVRGTVQLSNVRVVGARKYKVGEVEVRLRTHRLDFTLVIPHLKSEFDLRANINVDEVHNHFNAHVNVSMHHLVIKGALQFKPKPKKVGPSKQKLVIVGTKYTVSSPNVEYNARDLKRSAQLSRHRSSRWIKKIAGRIAKKQALASAKDIIKTLNKVLSNYTYKQILDILLHDKRN